MRSEQRRFPSSSTRASARAAASRTSRRREIDKLLDTGQGGLYPLFRRCALAVLNSGAPTDNAKEIFDRYRDFDIRIVRHPWGVKLEMQNAPAAAFVDGADDPRHQGAPVRGAARRGVHRQRDHGERPLRPHRLRLHHQRRVPRAAQRAPARLQGAPEPGRVLGRALDRRRRSTSTPRTSATSWGCAASTSAPAADPAP